jgi:hypothetical protein
MNVNLGFSFVNVMPSIPNRAMRSPRAELAIGPAGLSGMVFFVRRTHHMPFSYSNAVASDLCLFRLNLPWNNGENNPYPIISAIKMNAPIIARELQSGVTLAPYPSDLRR